MKENMKIIKHTCLIAALLVFQGCATTYTVNQTRSRISTERQMQALTHLRAHGDADGPLGVAVLFDVGRLMQPATFAEGLGDTPKLKLLGALLIDALAVGAGYLALDEAGALGGGDRTYNYTYNSTETSTRISVHGDNNTTGGAQ